MVKIGPLRNTKAYLKAGALALLVSASTCIKRPALTKDIVEFSHPQAAKLIQKLEAGDRHSATIYLDEAAERLITKKQMKEYRKVPQRILDTLKTLPDTMEVYYQVYKGKADSYIQKQLKKADNLLTVGHGNTGRGYITLAGDKKAYEGDYIMCRTIEDELELYLVEWEEDIGYMASGVSVDYSFGPEGISDCEPVGNIWDESYLGGIGAFCEYGDYCIYGGQDEYPTVQDFSKAAMEDDDCKEILEEYDIDEILPEHVETAWYVCGFILAEPVKGSIKVWRIRNY